MENFIHENEEDEYSSMGGGWCYFQDCLCGWSHCSCFYSLLLLPLLWLSLLVQSPPHFNGNKRACKQFFSAIDFTVRAWILCSWWYSVWLFKSLYNNFGRNFDSSDLLISCFLISYFEIYFFIKYCEKLNRQGDIHCMKTVSWAELATTSEVGHHIYIYIESTDNYIRRKTIERKSMGGIP